MRKTTTFVIGRGIIGLSVAYELAKLGRCITLLGPSQRPGSASHAAVGVSSLTGHVLARQPLFAAKMQGHQGLKAWLAELQRVSGVAIPHDFTGVYQPFSSLMEFEGISERVFHRTFRGCHETKIVPWKDGPKYVGAFHYEQDLWFDPRVCLEALSQALLRIGASFDDGLVEKIVPHPDRGVTIHAGSRRFEAEEVVVATGIFSDEILMNSGIYHLKQTPVEGETLDFQAKQASATHHTIIRIGKLNAISHGGYLSIGSTSRAKETLAECRPSPKAEGDLRAKAAQYLDWTIQSKDSGTRWGVRGRLPDRSPAIGPLFLPGGDRRIWAALGFYKNGLQLGHLFAQKLASAMASSSLFSPDFPFLTDRFDPN